MMLLDLLDEAKRNKKILLKVSLIELINKELNNLDIENLEEKVFTIAILIELKSEMLLYLFGLNTTKKKNFENESDVIEIVEILEKTFKDKIERSAFIEKVSSNEIPLNRLSKIVKEILERENYYEKGVIENNNISLIEVMEKLKEKLKTHLEIDFKKLMEECTSKLEIIVTFLAVLILAKNRFLTITQEGSFSPIILKLNG
ncbi:MAG: segregation/condensation protein A [Caldisericaceae bacterium]